MFTVAGLFPLKPVMVIVVVVVIHLKYKCIIVKKRKEEQKEKMPYKKYTRLHIPEFIIININEWGVICHLHKTLTGWYLKAWKFVRNIFFFKV